MKQIPVKFKIVQTISEKKEISNLEILEILKSEYPFDKSINEKSIEDYLLSLKVIGIIELTTATIGQDEKLKMWYKITEYGTTRIKYIK